MNREALYERYKNALRRGHVASMRGILEDALTAYDEAATIAPERSTPHTSAGMALLRRKRPAEALSHFAVALELSARDEAALLGRAQALAALDRRHEAAGAFDTLAESHAAAGRLADAVDAARRGLELAEGRDRRRALQRLIASLRASEPGEPGRIALEHALLVLEGPAMTIAAAAPTPGTGSERVDNVVDGGADPEVQQPEDTPGPDPGEAAPGPPTAVAYRRALDRDLDPDVDAGALALLAEDAVDAGDPGPALERLLDLAAAYRRQGSIDAALDACYLALARDPRDAGLHLALVELYDERGWGPLADEKLDLVEALVALDGDADAIGRVAATRQGRS